MEVSCAGNIPASPKRGSPFLSSHWKLKKEDSPGPKQESQKKAKEFFATALSISSQSLGYSGHKKDLDPTHGPHSLRKPMFSSMGTGPQRGKCSHLGTQKDLTMSSSLNHIWVVAALTYLE